MTYTLNRTIKTLPTYESSRGHDILEVTGIRPIEIVLEPLLDITETSVSLPSFCNDDDVFSIISIGMTSSLYANTRGDDVIVYLIDYYR